MSTSASRFRLFFSVLALSAVLPAAYGGLLFNDGFPVGTPGGYPAGSKNLYNNTTTNAIFGFSGKWVGDTGVEIAEAASGLSFPAAFGLEETGAGGAVILHSNASANDPGRLVVHKFADGLMPSSGTVYFRCLMALPEGINSSSPALGNAYAVGLTEETDASSQNSFVSLPATGLYVGFFKTAAGFVPMVRVGGVNHDLGFAGPVYEPLVAIVRVQIGAAEGGADIVSAFCGPVSTYAAAESYQTVFTASSGIPQAKSLFLGGYYPTGGKRVKFDEIAMGTAFVDVTGFTPGSIGLWLSGTDVSTLYEAALSGLSFGDLPAGATLSAVLREDESGTATTNALPASAIDSDGRISAIVPVALDTGYSATLLFQDGDTCIETDPLSFHTRGKPVVGVLSSTVDGTGATLSIQFSDVGVGDVDVEFSVTDATAGGAAVSAGSLAGISDTDAHTVTVQDLAPGHDYVWTASVSATGAQGETFGFTTDAQTLSVFGSLVWTGAGDAAHWSDAANFDPAVSPNANLDVTFPDGSAANEFPAGSVSAAKDTLVHKAGNVWSFGDAARVTVSNLTTGAKNSAAPELALAAPEGALGRLDVLGTLTMGSASKGISRLDVARVDLDLGAAWLVNGEAVWSDCAVANAGAFNIGPWSMNNSNGYFVDLTLDHVSWRQKSGSGVVVGNATKGGDYCAYDNKAEFARGTVFDAGGGNFYIGYRGGGNQQARRNSLTLSGGSVLTNVANLALACSQGGDYGKLVIQEGSKAYSAQGGVGGSSASNSGGSFNSAIVTGAGSEWALAGSLHVGTSGGGTAAVSNKLVIADGGKVSGVTTFGVGSRLAANSSAIASNLLWISTGRLETHGEASIGAGYFCASYDNLALVDGADSSWNADGGTLNVSYGRQGRAMRNSVVVRDGGRLEDLGNVRIGVANASAGDSGRLVLTNGAYASMAGTSGTSMAIGYSHGGNQPNPARDNAVVLHGGDLGNSVLDLASHVLYVGYSPSDGKAKSDATNNVLRLEAGGVLKDAARIEIGYNPAKGATNNVVVLAGGTGNAESLVVSSGNGLAAELTEAGIQPLRVSGTATFAADTFVRALCLSGDPAGEHTLVEADAVVDNGLSLDPALDSVTWRLKVTAETSGGKKASVVLRYVQPATLFFVK